MNLEPLSEEQLLKLSPIEEEKVILRRAGVKIVLGRRRSYYLKLVLRLIQDLRAEYGQYLDMDVPLCRSLQSWDALRSDRRWRESLLMLTTTLGVLEKAAYAPEQQDRTFKPPTTSVPERQKSLTDEGRDRIVCCSAKEMAWVKQQLWAERVGNSFPRLNRQALQRRRRQG